MVVECDKREASQPVPAPILDVQRQVQRLEHEHQVRQRAQMAVARAASDWLWLA